MLRAILANDRSSSAWRQPAVQRLHSVRHTARAGFVVILMFHTRVRFVQVVSQLAAVAACVTNRVKRRVSTCFASSGEFGFQCLALRIEPEHEPELEAVMKQRSKNNAMIRCLPHLQFGFQLVSRIHSKANPTSCRKQ